MRSRALSTASLIAALLAFAAVPLLAQDSAIYRTMARRLVSEAARIASQAGESDTPGAMLDSEVGATAVSLVRRARTLDPTYGDAHVLLAELLTGRAEHIPTIEFLLSQALNDDLERYGRLEVAERYAQLLLETGRSSEAVGLLEREISEFEGVSAYQIVRDQALSEDSFNPDASPAEPTPAFLLYVQALHATGDQWLASRWLEVKRRQFPLRRDITLLAAGGTHRFGLRFLEWLDGRRSYEPYSELIERVARSDDHQWPAQVREIVGEFYATGGGSDPAVAARLGLTVETDGDKLALEAGARIGSEGGDQLLELDVDGNGRPEQRYEIVDGLLERWSADANQDGITEAGITLAEGGDLLLRYRNGQSVVGVRFAVFPRAVEVWSVTVERATDGGEALSGGAVRRFASPFSFGPAVMLERAGSGDRISWPRSGSMSRQEALEWRVTVAPDLHPRAERLLSSDEAQPLDERHLREIELELREWNILATSYARSSL